MDFGIITNLNSYVKSTLTNPLKKAKTEQTNPLFQRLSTEPKGGRDDKLSAIILKMQAGEELTAGELSYLKENSPETYSAAVKAAQERQAYEGELQRCKTKEDVRLLHLAKITPLFTKANDSKAHNDLTSAQAALAEASVLTAIFTKFTATRDYAAKAPDRATLEKAIQAEKDAYVKEGKEMGVNLPTGYQLLAKQFDMERVTDGSVRFDKQAMKDRFTPDPSGVRFSPPDWSKIFTKQEPAMSEDEFEKAIAEQVVKDFENGYRRFQSVESANLEQAFIQAISPDRKAIYAESMSKTGGQMNLAHSFYTGGGEKVLHYNTQEGQWMNTMTSTESARFRQFADIYNKAYLAAHNAAQGGTSPSTSSVDYRA